MPAGPKWRAVADAICSSAGLWNIAHDAVFRCRCASAFQLAELSSPVLLFAAVWRGEGLKFDPNQVAALLDNHDGPAAPSAIHSSPAADPPKLHVRLFAEPNGDVSYMDVDSVTLQKDHGIWLVGVTVYFIDDGWPEYRSMGPSSPAYCGQSEYYINTPINAVPLVYWFDCGQAPPGFHYGINTRPILSIPSSEPTLPSFIANYACPAAKEKLSRQLGVLR